MKSVFKQTRRFVFISSPRCCSGVGLRNQTSNIRNQKLDRSHYVHTCSRYFTLFHAILMGGGGPRCAPSALSVQSAVQPYFLPNSKFEIQTRIRGANVSSQLTQTEGLGKAIQNLGLSGVRRWTFVIRHLKYAFRSHTSRESFRD